MEDRVHPDLSEFFLNLEEKNIDDIELVRTGDNRKRKDVHPDIRTKNHFINSQEGHRVRVRIYTTKHDCGIRPGLLWIHGGGYISGKPEINDRVCQRFVLESGCNVVSVAYRLAPEHPYPAALNDCYTALKWLYGNADRLQINTDKLAVAGVSAGGGLATALTLLVRDYGGPEVAFQMPLYPMIDDRMMTPSSKEFTDKRVWNAMFNEAAWCHYLGKKENKEINAYAAPGRATDLTGLPPTYTCVGQLDPFRDETIDYVTRLSSAGIPVEFHLYPGCFHGFESMVPDAEISKRAEGEYVNALKRAFQGD